MPALGLGAVGGLDLARGGLLTLGAGLPAAGALVFTARNVTLAGARWELSARTFAVTEQGQVTERYSRGVEQLGSEKLDIGIGVIYALERVARDSSRDHPTIMEVLAAFVREHSHEDWGKQVSSGQPPERSTRPDVQAALTVIGCLNSGQVPSWIDLCRANVAGANLTQANLTGTDFTRADLTDAQWPVHHQDVPEGWLRGSTAYLLKRASKGSGQQH
jgi:Pentapeptide repeats (8 copies)